jgi:RNA-binding protein
MIELAGFQRKWLRERAHALSAVVCVGQAGLSDKVIGAVDEALLAHELIKVRMLKPSDKKGTAQELARRCRACLCGLIGHTVILYRPHPQAPRMQLPVRDG